MQTQGIGLSGALRKTELYDRLLQSIELRFPSSDNIQSLGEWAASVPIVLDGRPFSFARHEYLREPYPVGRGGLQQRPHSPPHRREPRQHRAVAKRHRLSRCQAYLELLSLLTRY